MYLDIIYNSEYLLDNKKKIPYLLILLSIIFAILGWVLANGQSKTQYVRLVDIFIYGPYLTYLAFQKNYVFTIIEKIFLLFLGITTITYNGKNYLKIK
jgi:intracellular septation protein A